MPGRKLNIIKRLGKEQSVFGSRKFSSNMSKKAKYQKKITESNDSLKIDKINRSKALFAKNIKIVQSKLSTKKQISETIKRQAKRKELIKVIKGNKLIRLPDSTKHSLETIEQELRKLSESNCYDIYFKNLDIAYTKSLAKLAMNSNSSKSIIELVDKVGVAITIHSEFLEKKINFDKKKKSTVG